MAGSTGAAREFSHELLVVVLVRRPASPTTRAPKRFMNQTPEAKTASDHAHAPDRRDGADRPGADQADLRHLDRRGERVELGDQARLPVQVVDRVEDGVTKIQNGSTYVITMRTSRVCAVSGAVQRLIPQASVAQRKRPADREEQVLRRELGVEIPPLEIQ